MSRLIRNSVLAALAGVTVGNLISDPYHTPRVEVPLRLAPERSAPKWVSRFVHRFQERNGRLPSQHEMESLAAQEFAGDVRRMKLTWLGEVRWLNGGRKENVLLSPVKP